MEESSSSFEICTNKGTGLGNKLQNTMDQATTCRVVPLHIAAYNKPDESDPQSFEEIRKSFERVSTFE